MKKLNSLINLVYTSNPKRHIFTYQLNSHFKTATHSSMSPQPISWEYTSIPTPLSGAGWAAEDLIVGLAPFFYLLFLALLCGCIVCCDRCENRACRRKRVYCAQKEDEVERMLEQSESLQEEYLRSRSESRCSSVRTETTGTRWSSVLPDGTGVYVLPPISEVGSIEEE